MLSHSPPRKSLQIKQDNKLFSRIQSKEITSNVSTPSFRVYYGGVSGSVPFLWESQPGTPKHPSFSESSSSLPPLSPPPSYYSHNYSKQITKKHPRSKLLNALLFKINLKKTHIPSSPNSSPSFSSVSSRSSSHSSVSFSTTTPSKGRRSRFSSEGSSFDEEEEVSMGSPNSTLCFGVGRDIGGGIRGVCSVAVMKKALMGIVGRRSA
ncbi:hypothetical protein Vadar_026914 [Vaccinium darrowii]|uniref:Uncharacterized protein n=1 Tax=Vaccinium darrowii TaxID=229202 RepID=A0ACB7ZN18_9ERIC|nr:hypothetical protein Vadar_026914 [Vaccinium darrowii]